MSNKTVLQSDESHVPDQEPSQQATNAPRAMAEVPDAIDDNRAEQQQASTPHLAPWHAEKYQWVITDSGYAQLRVLDEYMNYVRNKIRPCINHAIGVIFPNGQADQTTEAEQVALLIADAKAYRETLLAVDEAEAVNFDKMLVARATDNAIYSVNAQHELRNWSQRFAAQGKDASQDNGFCDKEARRDSFMIRSGIFWAVARDVALSQNLDDAQIYDTAVTRVLFRNRDFVRRDLMTPQEKTAQDEAGAQAAIAVAEAY